MRYILAVLLLLPLGCSGGDGSFTPPSGSGGTVGGGGGGEGQGTTVDATSGHPLPGQKRVFVTSSAYGGHLQVVGRGADGLAGADNLCKTAADAALLGGAWRAWLSSALPTATAVHAVDRITDVGPWYLLDGQKAFNNKANLMTSPLAPLDIDENARRVLPAREVWTGTQSGGTRSGQDCGRWIDGSSFASATIGSAGAGDKTWTDLRSDSCGTDRRLYCFEQ